MNNADIVVYQRFLNESMLELVKKILTKIKADGLPENSSLYFSFQTDNPMVKLSDKMKMIYPKEITIVLQYQFHDLQLGDDYFSVVISFSGIKETICIPFCSLTSVVDVNNGLSLKLNPEMTKLTSPNNITNKELEHTNSKSKSLGKIVVLDNFRNKHKD
jgi:hypothetical protein